MLFMDGIDTLLRELPDGAARCPATSSPSSAASRSSDDEPALASRLGYTRGDCAGCTRRPGGAASRIRDDIRRVIDRYGYLDEWRANYRIQSVRASLRSARITCIDARHPLLRPARALFPATKRASSPSTAAIPKTDEECGHCVALYWGADGRVGAFSQVELRGPRAPRRRSSPTRLAIAASYAEAYVAMGVQPALLRRHHPGGGRAATSTGASHTGDLN